MMKYENGFIQIPILIVIISIITASAGAGVVLHKQGKLTSLVVDISEVFNKTEEVVIVKDEEIKVGELQNEKELKLENVSKEEGVIPQKIDEDEIVPQEKELVEKIEPKLDIQSIQEGITEPKFIPKVEELEIVSKSEIIPEAEEPQSTSTIEASEVEELENISDTEELTEVDPCVDMVCPNCQYCDFGICVDYCQKTDTSCGCSDCVNCNINDGCVGNNYYDYFCDDISCKTNITYNSENCITCDTCSYYLNGDCENYCQKTDTSCGCSDCVNCNINDGCVGNDYYDYFCDGTSCKSNIIYNSENCITCDTCSYYLNGDCENYCENTDTNCGCSSCNNCNNSDGCSGDNYLDYYCSDKACISNSDDCSDCSCSCGGYNIAESIENNNCDDGKDNDCDGNSDLDDSGCVVLILTSPLGGNITQNSKLILENSPYIVTETIQILEGIALEIEPGVVIKFNPETSLSVGGELIAIGTKEQKIIFTSACNDPKARNWIGDTDAKDWGGINFLGESKNAIIDNNNYISGNIIKNCIIQYAFFGLQIGKSSDFVKIFVTDNIIRNNYKGIHISGDSVIINNIIDDNSETGIEISGGNSILLYNEITNNAIKVADLPDFDNWDFAAIKMSGGKTFISKNIIKNNARGFSFWFGADPIIQYNNIYNNQARNFKLGQSQDIQAINNYWGTTETSIIDLNILDYYDNIGLGKVIYQPIATSEISDAGVQ